jgi:hypothetical protein
LAVLLTPLSTPPGALVVSTSTTDELTTCSAGDGVSDAVVVIDGDVVEVGEIVIEDDGVRVADDPPDGVCEFDGVFEGVTLGVGVGVAATMP